MKALNLFAILFFVSNILFAQGISLPGKDKIKNVITGEESGPAKTYIKSFWKAIEKLKTLDYETKKGAYLNQLSVAEQNLEQTKEADPDYNTSSLETELSKYQSVVNKDKENKESARAKESETEEGFDEIHLLDYPGNKIIENETDLSAIEQSLKSMQEKMNAFLSSDLAAVVREDEESYVKKVTDSRIFGGEHTAVSNAKRDFENVTSAINALKIYYNLVWIKTRWNTYAQLFPGDAGMQENNSLVKAAVSLWGDKDAAVKTAGKNVAEIIKNTRMHPASRTDPAFEKEVAAAITRSNFGKGRTVVKVVLLNSGWEIMRNEISGIILLRRQACEAVTKGSDGKCILHHFSYRQDYDGSKYMGSYITFETPKEILCENVGK